MYLTERNFTFFIEQRGFHRWVWYVIGYKGGRPPHFKDMENCKTACVKSCKAFARDAFYMPGDGWKWN